MKTFKVTILSSAAVFASACGPIQSSPAKDYDEVRRQAKPTTVEQSYKAQQENKAELERRQQVELENERTQAELEQEVLKQREALRADEERTIKVSKGLIDIRTEGSLNFIENKTSEFIVSARVLQLKLNFELVFSGLPEGAVLETVNGQTKKVKWAPKAGFVESGKHAKSVKFDVELKPASSLSAADQRLFDAETTKETFEIVVAKSKENPIVQKVSGLEGVVQEGTKVKFVVEVRDPGAQGSVPPKVTIKEDSAASRETVSIDGSAYISVDPDSAPRSSAPGIWNFYFVYDTSTKSAPRPSKLGAGNKRLAADEIPVRFKIEVASPSERSTATSKEFRLKYNTIGQAPQFSIADGQKLLADVGSTLVVDINITSKITGAITVNWRAAQEALNKTFPNGFKSTLLRCKDNGTAAVSCRFAWKVPCDESLVGSTHKLALSAINKVGAVETAGSTEQVITITKNNETNCTAANPTAGGN